MPSANAKPERRPDVIAVPAIPMVAGPGEPPAKIHATHMAINSGPISSTAALGMCLGQSAIAREGSDNSVARSGQALWL